MEECKKVTQVKRREVEAREGRTGKKKMENEGKEQMGQDKVTQVEENVQKQ